MNSITLRVLDGADRGRVFETSQIPITIGREEGNSIQLNDERVSRFHIKIQLDHDNLVLTDLESTNGTRVNNEEVQLRILRFGDMISVGRSTLVYGSREEINQRMEKLKSSDYGKRLDSATQSSGDDINKNWKDDPNYQLALLSMDPPVLPDRMSPGQAAQLSEILEFFHVHFRNLIHDVELNQETQAAEITKIKWHQMLDMQSRIAEYLRQIGRPD